eukprot:m51a1_g7833 hypothetical protein (551) ;mRNA; f:168391-170298
MSCTVTPPHRTDHPEHVSLHITFGPDVPQPAAHRLRPRTYVHAASRTVCTVLSRVAAHEGLAVPASALELALPDGTAVVCRMRAGPAWVPPAPSPPVSPGPLCRERAWSSLEDLRSALAVASPPPPAASGPVSSPPTPHLVVAGSHRVVVLSPQPRRCSGPDVPPDTVWLGRDRALPALFVRCYRNENGERTPTVVWCCADGETLWEAEPLARRFSEVYQASVLVPASSPAGSCLDERRVRDLSLALAHASAAAAAPVYLLGRSRAAGIVLRLLLSVCSAAGAVLLDAPASVVAEVPGFVRAARGLAVPVLLFASTRAAMPEQRALWAALAGRRAAGQQQRPRCCESRLTRAVGCEMCAPMSTALRQLLRTPRGQRPRPPSPRGGGPFAAWLLARGAAHLEGPLARCGCRSLLALSRLDPRALAQLLQQQLSAEEACALAGLRVAAQGCVDAWRVCKRGVRAVRPARAVARQVPGWAQAPRPASPAPAAHAGEGVRARRTSLSTAAGAALLRVSSTIGRALLKTPAGDDGEARAPRHSLSRSVSSLWFRS